MFDSKAGVFAQQDPAIRPECDYCQGLQGGKLAGGKECIVLDHSDTSLVAHWIRDEIREIDTGVYLGKVYWSDKRLIDFALEF